MEDDRELADVLTHIVLSIERSGEILTRVTALHSELVDLHAEVTSAAVELEAILKRAEVARPGASDAST